MTKTNMLLRNKNNRQIDDYHQLMSILDKNGINYDCGQLYNISGEPLGFWLNILNFQGAEFDNNGVFITSRSYRDDF